MFDFSLYAIDDIEPWGAPPDQTLSWYGLTMGTYSVRLKTAEILRYSPDAVDAARKAHPNEYPGPLVDYQVARLHEDLLAVLADVLHPVPEDIAQILSRATAVGIKRRARELWEESDDSSAVGLKAIDSALDARQLDTGYLSPNPLILVWRHADVVHVEWDGENQTLLGTTAWASPSGHVDMPVADFESNVAAFHRKLTQQMSTRIDEIRQRWARPEVRVDLDELSRSQLIAEDRLQASLKRTPAHVVWDDVRRGLTACGAESG